MVTAPFSKKLEEFVNIGFDYFKIALHYPLPDDYTELEKPNRGLRN